MYRGLKRRYVLKQSAKLPPASHCLTVFPPELTLSHCSVTFPVSSPQHFLLQAFFPHFNTVLSPVIFFTHFLTFSPNFLSMFCSFRKFICLINLHLLPLNTSLLHRIFSLCLISLFSLVILLTHHCSHSLYFFTHLSSTYPSLYLPLQYPIFSFVSFLFPSWLSFSVSHSLPPYSVSLLSVLPTSSALRSCSTGDSLLSSAFIRSAKSAPALAPPLPVLLHHHHPLLPPLADQLAGTHSLHYLSACLPLCLETCLYICPKLKLYACCLVSLSVFLAVNLSLLNQQFACGSSGIIWPFPF